MGVPGFVDGALGLCTSLIDLNPALRVLNQLQIMCLLKLPWDIGQMRETEEEVVEEEEFELEFINFLLKIDGLQEVEEEDWLLLCHHQRGAVNSLFTALFKGRAAFKKTILTLYSIIHVALSRKHC